LYNKLHRLSNGHEVSPTAKVRMWMNSSVLVLERYWPIS
jgi:hypothetical protein